MADQVQPRTINHAGQILGDGQVTLSQNQVNPQSPSPIITFECPKKFKEVNYIGNRDATRFIPRAVESVTGTTGDDTVQTLEADIQPVHGEEEIADQDYPVVQAVNVATGSEIAIDAIDYAANEVTLAADPADGETVKLFPIITEGDVLFQAKNSLGQNEGRVWPWSTPVFKWHDFRQLQRGREVNLHGTATFSRHESLEVLFDSPRQVVWVDTDYSAAGLGEFVSTFDQDCEINLG